MRRFCKDDIEFHANGFQHSRVAVNIKVYKRLENQKLPLDLGGYSDDGGVTWHQGLTDPQFTWEWIEEHVSEDEMNEWFATACSDGVEMLVEYAEELFPHDKFYQEGRQGGWIVMDGAYENVVEHWDAIQVSKWGKFAKYARAAADDIPYKVLDLIYINVFERGEQ